MNRGKIQVDIRNSVGYITFYHPASNSFPSNLLAELAQTFTDLDQNTEVKSIVLQSEGRTFCAGASFDELLQLDNHNDATAFFMGFANVINAMRKTNKFIIAKVQGKAVGGGVGLIAASDYAMATDLAAVKLSELSIGIGPFVIAPAVKRKTGSAFAEMSINASKWHNAFWAREKGLFAQVLDNQKQLDNEVTLLAEKLAAYDVVATQKLKREIWQGTEHWDHLLAEKAEISAGLVLQEFTKQKLQSFKK
jgi:methylglutaconyl-CoA hydratase